jgi:Sulfotransferase domain
VLVSLVVENTPQVAFCTTCKGRTQHLEETLPANLRGNPRARFVVVNYNSPDRFDDFIRRRHLGDIDSGRLTVYRFTEPGPFRMAHAKNLAHRLALQDGATVLVNIDADNFAGDRFDEYVATRLEAYAGDAFLWANMRKGEMHRGISGRIAVPAHAFLAAGGYDEIFETWSPDDKDFNARLRRLGFRAVEIDEQYLDAINHNDKMRFREYPDCKYDAEDFALPDRKHVRIANAGRIGCGVVYKNFGRDPIEILPVPTRIFGIGMHKTATTSLARALEVLGYDTAHWKNAHWAKAIWEEMKARGSSPTLERSYALCDLPIPLLFRELDAAYPESKFILTLRTEDSWIESVRTHWSDKNPWRAQWDTDPFTHRIHRELYSGIRFNEPVMRERFRRHNADVLEHFKDRPQNLLVMNMSAGAGWYELCGFLRRVIPDGPYPRENKY